MTKVVWLPNETDYSYCEFVAPNTPYYSVSVAERMLNTILRLHISGLAGSSANIIFSCKFFFCSGLVTFA